MLDVVHFLAGQASPSPFPHWFLIGQLEAERHCRPVDAGRTRATLVQLDSIAHRQLYNEFFEMTYRLERALQTVLYLIASDVPWSVMVRS